MDKDEFEWLEDQKEPKAAQWEAEQARIATDFVNKLPERKEIRSMLEGSLKIETFSSINPEIRPQSPSGYRYFQYRRKYGEEFSVYYYSDELGGEQKVALDPNLLSKDGKLSVNGVYPSDDGSMLIYEVSERGSDLMSIHVKDIDKNVTLDDVIPPIRSYSRTVWLKDGSGFFYALWPDPKFAADKADSQKVYLHMLGETHDKDLGIFGAGLGPEYNIRLSRTKEGTHLIIYVDDHSTDERSVYVKDLVSDEEPRLLVDRLKKSELFVLDIIKGCVYARTDYNAERGRIVKFLLDAPQIENWTDVVPEGKGVIRYAFVPGDKLVLGMFDDAHDALRVYSLSGEFKDEIRLPGLGSIQGAIADFKGNIMSFVYVSFNIPATVYAYDFNTMETKALETLKVDLDTSLVGVKQVWFSSKDGTKVPMFIACRNDIKLNGGNPMLMYGYGGFGIPQAPFFSYSVFKFIERGGAYALVNIRGGSEYGKSWHGEGRLMKKQNAFDDFISAGEWLIENGYTSKNRLVIEGGSNGGLLVAACMLQRPDLFSGVVCSKPVLDMLKFHKFGNGILWIDEFGNPDDPAMRNYLRAYSPYHNIKEGQRYPPIMLVAGENDTRVEPMHAYKMAALMQKKNPDNTVLLKVDRDMGHGFGQPVSKWLDSFADRWAFIYYYSGLTRRV